MKLRTASLRACLTRGRLDSHFFTAVGVAARDRVLAAHAAGAEVMPIGTPNGLGTVWSPSRFKRAYAAPAEASAPYLRPYDVLEYLPDSPERLSLTRTDDVDAYRVTPGVILQTISGRNLGPLTMADDHLAGFLLSHDMARIEIDDADMRWWTYAFLSSPTGQAILRQSKSGSVIDHLTVVDVANIEVPLFGHDASGVVTDMRRYFEHTTAARRALLSAMQQLASTYPMPPRQQPSRLGWTKPVSAVGRRLDAAYHDPYVEDCRDQLREAGGVPCGDLATAFLPARYKRFYVDASYGRPIVSGRQLLQINPVNLRYIADRSFNDPERMVLCTGMVAFGAVGRWEGRLGMPALVTSDLDGWMASNDVMRLSPREGIDSGALWLALQLPQVRVQIASLPYGSVVDHTGSEDVEREVILPIVPPDLASKARQSWLLFDEARTARRSALQAVEALLDQHATEVPLTT